MDIKNETSAGGIVYKKNLNLKSKITNITWLICQHSYHKGWVFPKGLIGDKEKHEPMEQAALREVNEEGGIVAKIILPKPIEVFYTYKWTNSAHGKNDPTEYLVYKKVYYYLMEYISGDPKNHDWEMIDAKFVPEKDIYSHLTFPSDKEAFSKILDLFNSL